jgi:CreA protein
MIAKVRRRAISSGSLAIDALADAATGAGGSALAHAAYMLRQEALSNDDDAPALPPPPFALRVRSDRERPMSRLPRLILLAAATITAAARLAPAEADDLACISTTFRVLGANDKVCVSAFDDPKVPGVACHISQARTGGVKGSLGLAEDPSRFSIACRQVGPISTDIAKLPDEESVYATNTSLFFKHTHVYRVLDKKRNTLVYLAISDRVIEGSPQNAISTVPIMPWGR